MANSVKTIHMINGINVKDMSKDELISKIADAEGEIARLNGLETESTAITKEIERQQAFIDDVVKHLDARA